MQAIFWPQTLAQEWEVEAMPTFIFIKDEKAIDKLVGANKDELQLKIICLVCLIFLPCWYNAFDSFPAEWPNVLGVCPSIGSPYDRSTYWQSCCSGLCCHIKYLSVINDCKGCDVESIRKNSRSYICSSFF
ncbi:hypothetical protein Leryth_003627 [Lithospermum erythrorhizon]|nr:hypothetical protein Leryth_003627 [Lithospermum erythrorhizon]